MIVRVFHNLLRERNVFFIGVVAAVDHHGGETAVDAALADVEAVAMVKMQADGQAGLDHGRFHELHQVGVVRVFARAGGNLKDQRGGKLLCRFGDALHDLHVVDVERADGIAAFIGLFEHFSACDKRHIKISFKIIFLLLLRCMRIHHYYTAFLLGFNTGDGIFCLRD